MPRLPSCCTGCGASFTRAKDETRCPGCTPTTTPRRPDTRGTATERGYDKAWRKLSTRARKAQPWCTDCGSPDDLTADHSPTAWARHDAGLPIRLRDVDVVCRGCNAARGPARGDRAVDRWTAGKDADQLDAVAAALVSRETLGGDPFDSSPGPRGQEQM